ncbi:hypothetical protein O9993_12840 [Vibrio lentus]|nr:hypothetical protein [Vibrio lentus]
MLGVPARLLVVVRLCFVHLRQLQMKFRLSPNSVKIDEVYNGSGGQAVAAMA